VIRVGVQLPEVEYVARWPEYATMARAAEASGFDSIWLGDHLLYRDDGRPERGPWDAAGRAHRRHSARAPWSAGRLRELPPAGAARQDGRDDRGDRL
jgi:alkanesulfonate monooxygenase SsuD/methylene tetrahydromethanopterin reductase-like flavin-dependent oxidoreductase (luciferase family)